jgi:hypothetical protein
MNEKRARSLLLKVSAEASKDFFAQRVDHGWLFTPHGSAVQRRTFVVCDNGLVSPVNPGKTATSVMDWLASGADLL